MFDRLFVINNAGDATAAMREGATLIAITNVHVTDDNTEEGFKFLLGLQSGERASPFISNFL